MSRSPRTTALAVALVAVVALSGCAGIGGDGTATETPSAATDAPTDGPTVAPGATATTASASATTDDADATTEPDREATGTEPPDADATATASATPASTPTSGNASARFVEDGETLATVTLEVAANDSERAEGLMYRESLARNHGMVFVYDEPQRLSFWMKNTLVPLDMVFVAANGTVLNVEHADVPPENSTDYGSYTSDAPAQYVVEVNRGFANRTGVGPGTDVAFSGLNATGTAGSNGSAGVTEARGTVAAVGAADRTD
jgi:hypothetical protein